MKIFLQCNGNAKFSYLKLLNIKSNKKKEKTCLQKRKQAEILKKIVHGLIHHR